MEIVCNSYFGEEARNDELGNLSLPFDQNKSNQKSLCSRIYVVKVPLPLQEITLYLGYFPFLTETSGHCIMYEIFHGNSVGHLWKKMLKELWRDAAATLPAELDHRTCNTPSCYALIAHSRLSARVSFFLARDDKWPWKRHLLHGLHVRAALSPVQEIALYHSCSVLLTWPLDRVMLDNAYTISNNRTWLF